MPSEVCRLGRAAARSWVRNHRNPVGDCQGPEGVGQCADLGGGRAHAVRTPVRGGVRVCQAGLDAVDRIRVDPRRPGRGGPRCSRSSVGPVVSGSGGGWVCARRRPRPPGSGPPSPTSPGNQHTPPGVVRRLTTRAVDPRARRRARAARGRAVGADRRARGAAGCPGVRAAPADGPAGAGHHRRRVPAPLVAAPRRYRSGTGEDDRASGARSSDSDWNSVSHCSGHTAPTGVSGARRAARAAAHARRSP